MDKNLGSIALVWSSGLYDSLGKESDLVKKGRRVTRIQVFKTKIRIQAR